MYNPKGVHQVYTFLPYCIEFTGVTRTFTHSHHTASTCAIPTRPVFVLWYYECPRRARNLG